MKSTIVFIFSLLLSFILFGCGGGSAGGTVIPSPSNASSLGISSGVIKGFGSVFVNGIKFNTDNAQVMRSGNQVNDVRELRIGMNVTIEGDLDKEVASSVSFEETVKGPVDSLAPLTVLGQTVITNAATVFNDSSLTNIAIGDILEISGLRDGNDDIVASFIERKNNPTNVDQYNVTGHVRNLNISAMTFEIDGLIVNYSSANLNDLPGGVPAEALLVEVKDENTAYAPGSLSLLATKVETAFPLGNRSFTGRKIEIESLVIQVISATEFRMGGFSVVTSPATQFLFGTPNNITTGTKLEVEGIVDNNGVLQARKVKFEDNDARLQARVQAINTTTNIVTLLGIPVTVTGNTALEDQRSDNASLALGDIQVGDFLEIRGFVGANGAFTASELDRENDDTKVEIRAPASAKDPSAGTVTLLGQRINSNAGTQFNGLDDERISSTQFFDAITPGLTIVEAKWDPFTDIGAPVKELELED